MGVQEVPRRSCDILFVVSGDYEPSSEIERRFAPLRLGSGMVEASIRLVQTLAKMEATTRSPDLVLSLGLATAAHCSAPAIFQVDAIIEAQPYRDVEHPSTMTSVRKALPDTRRGLGDFVGLEHANLTAFLQTNWSDTGGGPVADMVDPEGFAIAKISEAHGIPAILIRGTVAPVAQPGQGSDSAELQTTFLQVCERVLAAYST